MPGFKLEHKNPEGLFSSRAFSQSIVVSGKAKTIYMGGQNAINVNNELIGPGDLALQVKQALRNIATILSSENAGFNDLVKLNIYLLNGSDPRTGLKAYQEVVGESNNPPLVTVLFVSDFARPSCLVEIDGIAVIEDKE